MQNRNKQVTFLTGASSGLGYSLARLLAADGDAVALAARREHEMDELAQQIRASGGTALPIVCDVSERSSVQQAVQKCERELGPVDCLIVNAGVGGITSPEDFDAAVAERILRTNLLGAVYCIEATMPGMVARGRGQIVGISSLASYRGLPGAAAYCASKSGLNALLESLRIGLRRYNVSVTTICPGYVRTPMTAPNTGPMPFLMEQEDAARLMFQAIRKKKTFVTFPWPLALVVKFGRWLPDWVYDRAFARAAMRKDPA